VASHATACVAGDRDDCYFPHLALASVAKSLGFQVQLCHPVWKPELTEDVG